jgi:cell division protein FtsB
MKFGKQNSYKAYLYSRPVIVVLLVLVALLSRSVYERLGVERDMSDRRARAEAELERLQDRKVEIEDRVEYLEGERGIEEEIRKNFDVAREGEQVIILTGEEKKKSITTDEEKIDKSPWYQFWR